MTFEYCHIYWFSEDSDVQTLWRKVFKKITQVVIVSILPEEESPKII